MKKPHLIPLLLLLLSLSPWSATLGLAQRVNLQSNSGTQEPRKPADPDAAVEEWQALHEKLSHGRLADADSTKNRATGRDSGAEGATRRPNRSEPQVDAAARRQAAIELAGQFRAFEQKHASHPVAKQARRQEALALLHAAFLGDETAKPRRDQLVAELRGDASLTQTERCEVAAYAENLAIMRARLPHLQKLDAHEQVARRMISEFPQVPTSYESLFAVAKTRSDDSAAAVARELLAIVDTPKHVKADAEAFLVRHGLRERRLGEILAAEPTASTLLTQRGSQPVVLYTWATWSPGSIAMAKRLAAEAPPNVILIGLNLDTDSAAAQIRAQDESLVGDHIYDPQGRAGTVAKILGCNTAGLVLVTDRAGRIASISAQRDWNATVAKLRRE